MIFKFSSNSTTLRRQAFWAMPLFQLSVGITAGRLPRLEFAANMP